jgi:hypothetical protein
VTDKYEFKVSKNSGFKDFVSIALEEALTALEESIRDLGDEQVKAFPVEGRNNIAWIAMHSLAGMDIICGQGQGSEPAYSWEPRWDLWQAPPEQKPKPGDEFPSREELMQRINAVRKAVAGRLAETDETELLSNRAPKEWNHEGNSADLYARSIYHTMAHVRQIWLLRGAMGLAANSHWPTVHWM